MLHINDVELRYPNGKGVFDLNFQVNSGEAVGYLGPNGAGKTTTLRILMGFMDVNRGQAQINHLNCYTDAAKIMGNVGYIPGEIHFPEGMTGEGLLHDINKLRGTTDASIMHALLTRFQLDLTGKISKYSKGMKQKLGIVIACMHNPAVYIFDEPTSGLDPLMQNEFIQFVLEEKKKGKTILLSSHSFEEVERICDRVCMIKEGRIITQSTIQQLKANQRKSFTVQTNEIGKLIEFGFEVGNHTDQGYEVFVKGEEIDSFIKKLATIEVQALDVKSQNLEDIFLHLYRAEVEQ